MTTPRPVDDNVTIQVTGKETLADDESEVLLRMLDQTHPGWTAAELERQADGSWTGNVTKPS